MKALAMLAGIACLAAGQKKPSPVLEAMQLEMERSMQQFKKQATPPYFLSYAISETEQVRVAGSFGTLTSSAATRQRLLDIDLRVGSYDLDNTRPIRGNQFMNMLDAA